MSSDIIYESENLSNTTDEEIHYDSESSVSDSGNSFENENEEHLVISTASGTEMLFLVGGRSKFGRTIRLFWKKGALTNNSRESWKLKFSDKIQQKYLLRSSILVKLQARSLQLY